MCPQRILRLLAIAVFVSAGTATVVQASSPVLSLIMPRGLQRGTETTMYFFGQRLADAEEILLYQEGVEVLSLTAQDQQIEAKVKIADDAPLGQHIARVRTSSGISVFSTFYVGALPAVEEVEPNNDFYSPQKIELGHTIEGVIESEDVDYFVIDCKQGDKFNIEVEGLRLATTLFDPYVAILDPNRFELAVADDSPLTKQDPILAFEAPEDGPYVIQLRESAYGGNGNARYRMHVGTFPRPEVAFPAGGKMGEEMEIEFLGGTEGSMRQTIPLPAESVQDFRVFAETPEGISPSGIPFRLFAHGNALEAEPNNGRNDATAVELPNAFNGIISEEGDVDWYRFTAKKGQSFEVYCFARRVGSPLDSVMTVHSVDGQQIAGNDDNNGIAPDSFFRFDVPEDGEYLIRVFDRLRRGGETFVYRVELHPVAARLGLSIPRVARYSQDRQVIVVPRGNRFATLMVAARQNFGGPLEFEAPDLPEGVTMHAVPMPGNTNVCAIVFEAEDDAPIGGHLIDFQARHAENDDIVGQFMETALMLRGPPGQSFYWQPTVHQLAVAVAEEVPFSIELVPPKAPLVRNGSMQLKVIVHRAEGFEGAVNVQFPFRPPGVGATGSINIPPDQTEGRYPISANGNAPVQEWDVVALAQADVGGPAWVSSPLVKLRVAEPFSQVELTKTAVEQGQKTQVLVKFNHATEFEGTGKVRLLGLPNAVTAPEIEFSKDTEEAVFEITTDAASPAGTHKNIFAHVEFSQEGEPIVHRSGATEIRIDAPPPEEEGKPDPPKETKPPETPPEKPLSRLEKLRQEAKRRAGQANDQTDQGTGGQGEANQGANSSESAPSVG